MATKKWLEENKDYMREYYREYNRTHRERIDKNNKRIIDWFSSFKSNIRCKSCPETDAACLEFHHKDPEQKSFGICLGVQLGYSIGRIKKEIAKCDVLCSNCHRKLHCCKKTECLEHYSNRRRRYEKKLRQWIDEQKVSCLRCGEKDINCLDFHHRYPDEKNFHLGNAHRRMGKEKIEKEIAKCDVLCANCHRKLHGEEKQFTTQISEV